MDSQTLLRHLLRTPHTSRTIIATGIRPQTRAFALLVPSIHSRYLTTPRILQPGFWATLVPKPLRERVRSDRPREWNPATPYIVLSLLVGSQAIQLLWLKQERARSLRRAEAKIGILREVIERVQAGEEVDVEKVLGAGDEAQEAEWANVIKDLAEEESLFQSKQKRKALREKARREVEAEETARDAPDGPAEGEGYVKVEAVGGAKFY